MSKEGLLGGVRKAYKSKGDDPTLTRFIKTGVSESRPRHARNKKPGGDRTHFTSKVVQPWDGMLSSGHNSVKIGRDVRKGKLFRGYWIYTLSFEERVTCPRHCHHWDDCYGNNTPFAKRVDHNSPEFEPVLRANLERLLSVKGRVGILIRLHGLGDFFSVEYVQMWSRLLGDYERLAAFGYTAHTPHDGGIGRQVLRTKRIWGRRFAIRWSTPRVGNDAAVPFDRSPPKGVLACPEQNGATQCCATCALCWESTQPIGFKDH